MVSTAVIVFALAVGATYQAVGARRSRLRFAPPGRMIDVAGQRLHVVCAGRGDRPVFFEAGIGASSLSWTIVMREAAQFTRVCAYDRAGLGWSAPARARRTVERMLSELRGVREASAGAAPAVLVGHSFGAFLSLLYASRYPREIAGLVLVDPPTEWQQMTARQARMLWGAIQMSRVGGLLARVGIVRASLALLTGGAPGVPRRGVRIFGPSVARTLEHLVGEVRKLPPDVHPFVQAQWCEPKSFRAMAEHLAALRETAAAAAGGIDLAELPLVVVSAGDQPARVLADHRRLAGCSRQGRHVVAANSGHWVQLDRPDVVIATIRELLDALPAR